MPKGNGTGPLGMGPMTGRGAGLCAGNNFINSATGRGCGMGLLRGGGFGRRNIFQATGIPGWMRTGTSTGVVHKTDLEFEKQSLMGYVKNIVSELESAKKRLEEIEKSDR
jgi:hypothetical protein